MLILVCDLYANHIKRRTRQRSALPCEPALACEPTYTLHSPRQRSCPPPWNWYFPGAGLQQRSEAPWRGPLPRCQSHPWHAGKAKEEIMLSQGRSEGLLTPVVPSSCPLITPVAVWLVNKNRRRSLEKKTKEDWEGGRGMWRDDCEPHEHWDEIHRHTHTHTHTPPVLGQTRGIWPYHGLLEVTLVVDVVHFVGTRLIEVSVVIQGCDSQAALLLSTGSFY